MTLGIPLSDDITTYSIFPYADFDTELANQAKRIVSLGNSCVLGGNSSFNITYDEGNHTITLSSGKCIIDDVYIEISEDQTFDLYDTDLYISSGDIRSEDGYYYVILNYIYVKSRPHRVAKFYLRKPSERTNCPNNTELILRVLNATSGIIDSDILYQDPTRLSVYRTMPEIYSQIYNYLPTFNSTSDIGKIVSVHNKTASPETLYSYFGDLTVWKRIVTE